MRAEPRRTHPGAAVAIVAIATVIGGAAGYAGSLLTTPLYTSTAVLNWDPASLRYSNSSAYVPDSTSLGIQIQTQAQEVLSDTVVDPVSSTLGLTAAEVRDATTVTGNPGLNQISVAAEAETPAEARSIVSELTSEYQASVTKSFGDQLVKQAETLQGPIDALKQQQSAATAESALSDSLASQIGALASQQVLLRAQADDVVTPLSVLRAATTPVAPSTASAKALTAVGAGLGFLIGFGLFGLVRAIRWSTRRSIRPAEAQRPRAELEAA